MSLKFGTSGVRGLATDLTDYECYIFTRAFFNYLDIANYEMSEKTVAIAGDYRPSTNRILKAVAEAARDAGYEILNCGIIPTPALSYYAFENKIPSVMVTGSHIPDDRTGIKYNLPEAETFKRDEAEISKNYHKIKKAGEFKDKFFDDETAKESIILESAVNDAKELYVKRYVNFFSKDILAGKKVVFYGHTSVQREVFPVIFEKMGATVIKKDYFDKFVPIDTEAVRPEDVQRAKAWSNEEKPDAIMSADGDGDRPMLFDENGDFIRGDITTIICANYLEADSVSATASCNTALEKSKLFKKVNRTKIGSPYVAEAMQNDINAGFKKVVSYEANGGFLTGSEIEKNGKILKPLPTRDAVLPLLVALVSAIERNTTISELNKELPQRFVYSSSIKNFPTAKSLEIVEGLKSSNGKELGAEIVSAPAAVEKIDFTDGARMFLENEEIIHIRPSGNSPELRSYCEADTYERARELVEKSLKSLKDKYL